MQSFVGTKKIVKSGSSDAINVTKDIQPLGLVPGDEVSVRLAKPSAENDNLLKIITLFENGHYDITSRKWIQLPGDNEYDNPANYVDVQNIASVDDLESIQYMVDDVMHKYLLECNTSKLFYYSEDLRSFVRTFSRVNIGVDKEERTIRDKLRFEVLLVDYICRLVDASGLSKSPLLEARSLVSELSVLSRVYSHLIDNYLDDDSVESTLEGFNDDWNERQKAISRISSSYLVVTHYLEGDNPENQTSSFDVEVRDSTSKTLLDYDITNELSEAMLSGTEYSYGYKIYGPLDHVTAARLADYFRIGIQIGIGTDDFDAVISWCDKQYENFVSTFVGSGKDSP